MKKVTSFILIIVFAGMVSCKKDTELMPVKAGGILQKQGNTTYMYGTHKLVDYNGATIVVLESDKINLDQYLNQNIEVRGRRIKERPENGPDLIRVTKIK